MRLFFSPADSVFETLCRRCPIIKQKARIAASRVFIRADETNRTSDLLITEHGGKQLAFDFNLQGPLIDRGRHGSIRRTGGQVIQFDSSAKIPDSTCDFCHFVHSR